MAGEGRDQELAQGTRLLDRYSILDRVETGGMATIYRATDDRLDRVVCVKLLKTLVGLSLGSGDELLYRATYAHFLKEALALSRLQHPNTLRIYDFGHLDNMSPEGRAPFHVCEYLDGGTVETHVRLRGPLPHDEALSILRAITGALAEAHEQGIIHRDIKPSNILFARVRGELVPKLADFGISHSDFTKTDDRGGGPVVPEVRSSVALFSPRWAAPEQLCGAEEGPRTDVYAIGLLATFMLTGDELFGDDDVQTTFEDRVYKEEIVETRLAKKRLPRPIERVLKDAMRAKAEERIATVTDFLTRFEQAIANTHDPESRALPAQPPPMRTVSLSMPEDVRLPSSRPMVAAERVVLLGSRRARLVDVREKLDMSFVDGDGGEVRVRITMLPGNPLSLNVKGLTCFVALQGQRPSPAITTQQNDAVELVSAARQTLGTLAWSLGDSTPDGCAFVVDGHSLLVPYSEARKAVALMIQHDGDVVVMCQR